MLTEGLTAWRVAQPLYALGPLMTAAGVGFLAADASSSRVQVLLVGASALLAIGTLAWTWSVFLRATRVTDFAYGKLPRWPFATYVFLTIAGLFVLAAGLLSGPFPAWVAWVTLAADLLFLIGYLRFGDLPPFVSYLLFLLVGVAAW